MPGFIKSLFGGDKDVKTFKLDDLKDTSVDKSDKTAKVPDKTPGMVKPSITQDPSDRMVKDSGDTTYKSSFWSSSASTVDSKKDDSSSSWSWSRKTALKGLPKDTPAADVSKAKAAGINPPTAPKLFFGAQVKTSKGGTGTLVGFTSSGKALIKSATGKVSSADGDDKLSVLPNQAFRSTLQTIPAKNLHQVTAGEATELSALLATKIGWSGDTTVGSYVDAIRAGGFEAFVVGGAVRDALVGKKPRDVDLATTMWLDDVEEAFKAKKLDSGRTVSQYGTLLLRNLDVTSFKGARGEYSLDLNDDMLHRDFTINALYYDPASKIIADPFGTGVADAKSMTLRAAALPGQEKAWLDANPSIVLRFLKFTMRGYKPTPELTKLVKDNFKSCMSSMDSFRKSRTMDSIDGSKSEIAAEMKRLGFSQGDIDTVNPPVKVSSWKSDYGDSDGGSPYFRSWEWSSKKADDGAKDTAKADAKSEPKELSVDKARSTPTTAAVERFATRKKLKAVDAADSKHGALAIADGNLGGLPVRESEAVPMLVRAGFKKTSDDYWTASDKSWVFFEGGNAYRGVEDDVLRSVPHGVGPKKPTFGGAAAAKPAPAVTVKDDDGAISIPIRRDFSSGNAALEAFADKNGFSVVSPSYFDHGELYVARGHVGFLPEKQDEAAAVLKKAGFTKQYGADGLWMAPDKSWIRFDGGKVYRGIGKQVFRSVPTGTGPKSPSTSLYSGSDY
ncbi:MAG: hypothetical protein HY903_14595 [Deltaproteobacteria bacterium]|nr:hypothetical protein [Deltaproteobacteria bacterium]